MTLDDNDPPWPQRPWIMAAICALAGLAFHLLISHPYDDALADWRSALATAGAVVSVMTAIWACFASASKPNAFQQFSGKTALSRSHRAKSRGPEGMHS